MTIEYYSYWDFVGKLHKNSCTNWDVFWWADTCWFKASYYLQMFTGSITRWIR